MRTIPDSDVEVFGAGSWLWLIRLRTGSGPREFVERRDGKFRAVKVLPIFVEGEADTPALEIRGLIETLLHKGLGRFRVYILAVDRPITYRSSTVGLAENYQLELPGGIVGHEESMRGATLRELGEEAGSEGSLTVLAAVPLLEEPCTWDAGTHNEWYAIWCVLLRGTPRPPRREGIIPEKCQLVPLLEARSWLFEQRKKGICVEGYALHALDLLGCHLLGGWEKLRSETSLLGER